MNTKICKSCKEEKDISEFRSFVDNRYNKNILRYRTSCLFCECAKEKARNSNITFDDAFNFLIKLHKNEELRKSLTETDFKICTCPSCSYEGKPQPKDNFHKNNRTEDCLTPWCKECRNLYQRSVYDDTQREINRLQMQQWRKNNPGKSNEISNRRRLKLKECDILNITQLIWVYELSIVETILTGQKYVVDHIIPLSKEGKHEHHNVRVCSEIENFHKGNRINRYYEIVSTP